MNVMSRPFLWLLSTCLMAQAGSAAGQDRIGPTGVRGTFIVSGNPPSEAAKSQFFKHAKQDKSKTAILSVQGLSDDTLKSWGTAIGGEVRAVQNGDAENALKDATSAWVDAALLEKDAKLAEALRALMRRGGAVGIGGKTIEGVLPNAWIAVGEADDGVFAKQLAERPGQVGIRLSDDAVLVVEDREIRVAQGTAALGLAASESRPMKVERLTKKNSADLNQWRRAALGRTQAAFPPKTVQAPEVKHGTLMLIGGGGMPEGGLKRFIDLAGGPEAPIVVLPTSMPDPLPKSGGDAFLRKAGAKNVAVINARERHEVESPENLELLRKARGIWFGGGRQWRFLDAYEGTKAYPLLHDVLKRGGVIAGSSAGATIQGDYLVRGSPLGPDIMMAEGYERGFRFLPGVAVDQHFAQRKRFGDMAALMKTYPQYLGIGLDEATGIVVQGHVAEIIGRGEVHFYDMTKSREPSAADHDSFKAGARYDLKTRKPITE